MNETEAKAWIADVVNSFPADKGNILVAVSYPAQHQAVLIEWLTQAEAALTSVFPANHVVNRKWRELAAYARTMAANHDVPEAELKAQFHGVVMTADALLRAGRLTSLLDGIRAETVNEVLEQAELLNASGHQVAATVLAGGALETHLRNLCDRHGATWGGSGSIDKYKGALDQVRNNTGKDVISPTDSKHVVAWGGDRNDAAHKPTDFKKDKAHVQRLIEGVRAFIARTS